MNQAIIIHKKFLCSYLGTDRKERFVYKREFPSKNVVGNNVGMLVLQYDLKSQTKWVVFLCCLLKHLETQERTGQGKLHSGPSVGLCLCYDWGPAHLLKHLRIWRPPSLVPYKRKAARGLVGRIRNLERGQFATDQIGLLALSWLFYTNGRFTIPLMTVRTTTEEATSLFAFYCDVRM